MLSQDAERPIGIHHHCELAELLLVGNGVNYSSTSERIELERCNPSAVQLLYPPVLACTDRPGTMHQNDGDVFFRLRPRNAQLASDDCRLGILIAGQKLPSGGRGGLNGNQLNAIDRLRVHCWTP